MKTTTNKTPNKNPTNIFLKQRKYLLKLATFQMGINLKKCCFKSGKHTVLFSPQDLDLVASRRWTVLMKSDLPYVYAVPDANYRSFNIALHREIMGLKEGDRRVVDHINGNPCDNRRENLRVCTIQQNLFNQDMKKSTKAIKYKGVFYNNASKIHMRIVTKINGQPLRVQVAHKEERVCAYLFDMFAQKLFGEYAKTNKQIYPTEFVATKRLHTKALAAIANSPKAAALWEKLNAE